MDSLGRHWFEAGAAELAPRLLNKLVVSTVGGVRVVGRITEVEAYDDTDAASHTFAGPTERNRVMFGPAGHLYVYLSYGIHHCANIVAGPSGSGQAILLRALEPVDGLDTIRVRRGGRPDGELTNGPGKLCRALGIDLAHSGLDLLAPGAVVTLVHDGTEPPASPLIGPRIGISKAVDTPWRFRVPDERRGRRGRYVRRP
jgi:DNA-3-methyladenine glycosylase